MTEEKSKYFKRITDLPLVNPTEESQANLLLGDGVLISVKMPFGEMNQQLMKGLDGGPIRIENVPLPVLKNLKHCHTPQWNYNDHGKNFEYKNRCGINREVSCMTMLIEITIRPTRKIRLLWVVGVSRCR